MERQAIREIVEKRSVSMYRADWELVEREAVRLGLDISSTLRTLVRTHPSLQSSRDTNGK